jgi:hypothetical protein
MSRTLVFRTFIPGPSSSRTVIPRAITLHAPDSTSLRLGVFVIALLAPRASVRNSRLRILVAATSHRLARSHKLFGTFDVKLTLGRRLICQSRRTLRWRSGAGCGRRRSRIVHRGIKGLTTGDLWATSGRSICCGCDLTVGVQRAEGLRTAASVRTHCWLDFTRCVESAA